MRGDRTVVEMLALIADEQAATPGNNPYDTVAMLDAVGRATPPSDAGRRQRFDYEHAFLYLYSGQTRQAIDTLDRIRDGFESVPAELRTVAADEITAALAIAHLRLGEVANCIEVHNPDACLLPIGPAGVHIDQAGSLGAIDHFLAILASEPNDLTTRWLLNIAYMTVGGYPHQVPEEWLIPSSVFESDYEVGRFPDVAHEMGVAAVGLAGGVIVDDMDGDGRLDIVVSSWGLSDQLRYFRNEGDGTFVERTREAGLEGETGGLNIVQTDYDNDGHIDVLILRGAWLREAGLLPNSLLRGHGDGTFENVTVEAGLLSRHPTQVGVWGDYDNDGWLDLFIGNESLPEGAPPHPPELYRNLGDGTFEEISASVGLAVPGYIKGAAWGDYDNDGRLDLYVSRYGAANKLFRNEGATSDGGWRFVDVAAHAGVELPAFSFATWFWDFDNDGWQDIFVADYRQSEPTSGSSGRTAEVVVSYLGSSVSATRPSLYRNNGDGTFTDVGADFGLSLPTFTMGANFGDIDNDGFLDMYLGTGDPMYESLFPNRLFRNAQGRAFQDVTTSANVGHIQKGHGIAFGDIDNDGDQDIYAVLGGAFPGDIFHNSLFINPGHGNRWLTLVLEGTRSNRPAIGARVRVAVQTAAGKRDVYVTVGSGGSFGASPLRQEIGLGVAEAIEFVEVGWPGADNLRYTGIETDRAWRIIEGRPDPIPMALPTSALPPQHP
jgi:hypothetical protein